MPKRELNSIEIGSEGPLTLREDDHRPVPFLLIRVTCACGWGESERDGDWMEHFKETQESDR